MLQTYGQLKISFGCVGGVVTMITLFPKKSLTKQKWSNSVVMFIYYASFAKSAYVGKGCTIFAHVLFCPLNGLPMAIFAHVYAKIAYFQPPVNHSQGEGPSPVS